MNPDTPPRPAHGEKVQVFCLCRHCNQEVEVTLSKQGYSDFFDCPKCRKRIDSWLRIPCANNRDFEVHSKETMNEVRSTLEKVISREYRFIMDADEPASKEQKDFLGVVEAALAKLNPPQP